jgi:hypothetical protein
MDIGSLVRVRKKDYLLIGELRICVVHIVDDNKL